MRSYEPKFGTDSVNFAMLNRGKRSSIAIDLKILVRARRCSADRNDGYRRRAIRRRHGQTRLRLRDPAGHHPRLIYCAITGYGQEGPRADVAAHDLNYVAESGMLSLSAGADGARCCPLRSLQTLRGNLSRMTISACAARTRSDGHGLQDRYRNGREPVHRSCTGFGKWSRGKRVAGACRRPRYRGIPRYKRLPHA